MTATAVATKPTMTYEDANSQLFNSVFCPVFFHKLAADYGIQPGSQEEAVEFLQLAEDLQQAEAVNAVKSSSDRTTVVSQIRNQLRQSIGMPAANSQIDESAIKQAAAQFCSNPEIRDAALLYQDAMKASLVQ